MGRGYKEYDKPSRIANRVARKILRGKKGKAYGRALVDYLRDTIPLTEAYTAGRGFLPQMGGLLQQGINYQQSMLPAAAEAVQKGLAGNFFDIAPWQAYAERGLQRNTIPEIAQTFATLNSPLSSDTTGQIGNAIRDTYFGLGAQGAEMNFNAKNALINQGGLGNFFNAAQQPANLAFSGANQLFNADLTARQAEQSGKAGAATLFPSFVGGNNQDLSQTSSRGRISADVSQE